MKQKRLTKRRAEIFMSHFAPLLEANLSIPDGDLTGAFEECTGQELQDTIDAIFQLCYKRVKPPSKSLSDDEMNV